MKLKLIIATCLRTMKRFRGRKINVGGSGNVLSGYVNVDNHPYPGINLLIQPWEVSRYCRNSAEIRSDHLLEYLSFKQAIATLGDWYDALGNGSGIHIVVENMDHHLASWKNAVWSDEAWENPSSDARLAVAGLFEVGLGAEHRGGRKSGYNRESLLFLFSKTKFFGLKICDDGKDLIITARKQIGERQVGSRLEDIRADHRARYEYAETLLSDGSKVLDMACGVGYGSFILAGEAGREITGVDISEESVAYAKTYYQLPNIHFVQSDAYKFAWAEGAYDAIISFETLEHVPDPRALVAKMADGLKKDGLLICSTPNEQAMPFSKEKFPHHVRHMTPIDFEDMLTSQGFEVIERKSQANKREPALVGGWSGSYILAVCRKKS